MMRELKGQRIGDDGSVGPPPKVTGGSDAASVTVPYSTRLPEPTLGACGPAPVRFSQYLAKPVEMVSGGPPAARVAISAGVRTRVHCAGSDTLQVALGKKKPPPKLKPPMINSLLTTGSSDVLAVATCVAPTYDATSPFAAHVNAICCQPVPMYAAGSVSSSAPPDDAIDGANLPSAQTLP